MKNCKRAVDDGKKEKAGSFLFPSLPARFYFPPSLPPPLHGLPTTQRDLCRKERKSYTVELKFVNFRRIRTCG